MKKQTIKAISALEILDSRGNPTIEATVTLNAGTTGTAAVPSGASTGTHEAHELRDNDIHRYNGKGVQKAIANIHTIIAPELTGKAVQDQEHIDDLMIKLDGTAYKNKLGANAILAVSLACARAGANTNNLPLFQYLRTLYWSSEQRWLLPVPLMNVMNGGKHAPGSVDMQEFMIVPARAISFAESLRKGAEIYHKLKQLLLNKGLPIGVGDEGGFMPKLHNHKEVLELLTTAIASAGYTPGKDVFIALDPAANEFYHDGTYELRTERKTLNAQELISVYADWVQHYPIRSIEDGLAEDDWEGFAMLTKTLGKTTQIVGDDLFVTNPERLKRGIHEEAANAILVKVNQIGTLTETARVINQAKRAGFNVIISHRSGETEDTFIADLAVACNAGQLKSGAPCRTERVAKYNRLLRIERALGNNATVPQILNM